MGDPTFDLWRILGNDLPPRHAPDQTLTNLRFLLEREPALPGCTKRWLLNRIVDPAVESALAQLLEAHGQTYDRIPFEPAAYHALPFDPTGLPADVLRDGPLNGYLRVRALEFPFRHKTAYVTNNNGARNHAIARSREAGATWALPWDGACVVRPDVWEQLRAAARDRDARYLVVPLARFERNEDALDPARTSEGFDEPQVAIHRDATATFDPNSRYGNNPKVELLIRLRIPGRWDASQPIPWEPMRPRAAADADRAVTAGWVGRLSAGAPEIETSGAIRFRARIEGLVGFVDRLDRERVRRVAHPRELALYDEALLRECALRGADGRAVPLVAFARSLAPADDRARPWAERWTRLATQSVALALAGTITRDAPMRREAVRRLLSATRGPGALPPLPPLGREVLAETLAPLLPAFCDAVRLLNHTGELSRDGNQAVRRWADGMLASLPDGPLGADVAARVDATATAYDVATVVLAAFVGRPDRLLAGARAAITRAAVQFGESGVADAPPREQLRILAGWTILARYSEIVGEPLWAGMRTGRASPATAALDLLANHGDQLPADAVAAFRSVIGLPSPEGERLARERGEVPDLPWLQPWWWARVPAPAPRVRPAPR